MGEQQGGSSRVRAYPLPEKENQEAYGKFFDPVRMLPEMKVRHRRASRRRIWLFVFPLAALVACLGMTGYAVLSLITGPQLVGIPLTGGSPSGSPYGGREGSATEPPASLTPAPTQAHGAQPQDLDFIHEAAAQLEMCSESFREYFILEQMVIENPVLFENDAWRTDVTKAMHVFEDNCQTLGTLPAAPPAYVEVEHWLKMAADEVKPATASFTAAMEKEEAGQFHVSIQHMLKFVDYIHNAENAMGGMRERKEI